MDARLAAEKAKAEAKAKGGRRGQSQSRPGSKSESRCDTCGNSAGDKMSLKTVSADVKFRADRAVVITLHSQNRAAKPDAILNG